MCQTFFFIPDRWLGFPVFGCGWLLLVWGLVSLVWVSWIVKKTGWASEVKELAPFLLLVGAAILFVFPMLEVQAANGQVIGLPVRGYGTLLVCGVLAGWWLAASRAAQHGLSRDDIQALLAPIAIAGLVGARLFFVIEYWSDFRRPTLWGTFLEVVKYSQGGLVVYGSLIGGFLAFIWFARKRRLPILALGDVIAPGVVLGMAIGRVGCLLNGCCYGGLCEQGAWGIHFPRYSSVEQQVTSPPYLHQLTTGRLHGFVLSENDQHLPIVKSVEPNSPAEHNGLTAGSRLAAINGVRTDSLAAAEGILLNSGASLSVELADGQKLQWSIGSLPPRSRRVHPSQIYGAVSGLLICLVLLSTEPFLDRSGAVSAMLFTLYPPVRFLEERIRDDEPAQFGTNLTISQLVSIAVFVAALVTWFFVWRGKKSSARSVTETIVA